MAQYQVEVAVKATGLSSVQKLEKAVKNLSGEQDKIAKASNNAANNVRKFSRSAAGAGKSANSAVKGVQALNGAIAGITAKIGIVIAAFKGFQAATNAAFERDVAEQRLKNLTGSTEEYAAALQAAKDASQKFGLTQTEATQALGDTYARLSGLGFGLKEVTEIYNGFNKVARDSGVASEDAAGAFLQLSQALGSGKLQGDELRAILERMPQLAQLIAKEMGVTAGEIRKMGSDGKISSEIMYSALAKAAQGAGDLNGKLTSSQQSQMAFKQATEQLAVAVGQSLLPALTSTVNAMTGIVNGVTGVINAFNNFNQTIQQLANPLRDVTNSLSQIPGFAAAVADGFARLAKVVIGMIPGLGQLIGFFDKLAQVKGLFTGGTQGAKALAEETKKTEESARAALNQFTGMPPVVEQTKTATQQLAASTKAIAAAQQEANMAGQQAVADLDLQQQVKQALLQAEQQINAAKLQSAQADLEAATTEAGRIKAAQAIFELTKNQADLQYQSAVETAKVELLKKQYALDTAKVLQQQVEAEVALQRSKKIFNKHQDIALQAAAKGVEEAQKQLEAQTQITAAIESGAAATRDAQIEAAKVVLEQQKSKQAQDQVTESVNQTAVAMTKVADEAQRASTAAAGIAAAGSGLGGGGGGSTFSYGGGVPNRFKLDENGNIVQRSAQERQADINRMKMQQMNQMYGAADAYDAMFRGTDYSAAAYNRHKFGGIIGPIGSQLYNEYMKTYQGGKYKTIEETLNSPEYLFNRYAEGGYVTGPQQAVVGEGGEPEYIIPESKMSQAMARYSAGQRGDSVIPSSATVNVNYSGSTVNMGGEEYIKKGDVPGLLNSAVGQTLKTLRRSSNSRLFAGIDR